MIVDVVGGFVHLLFMLGYWALLSAPIWLIVWLVVDKIRHN